MEDVGVGVLKPSELELTFRDNGFASARDAYVCPKHRHPKEHTWTWGYLFFDQHDYVSASVSTTSTRQA